MEPPGAARGQAAVVSGTPSGYFFTGVELLEGVVADVFDVPPLFFDGFFDVSCFLEDFAGLLVSVLAGVWANVKGTVPNASAIASRVVFITGFYPWRAALARSQLHGAPGGRNPR